MRVVKPSSANNSPRNNGMHQRRRTVLNDPAYVQKAQQVLEQQQYLPTPGPDAFGSSCYEPVKRAPRPVSWHPSTTQIPQLYPQQHQHYPVSTQQPQYPNSHAYDYDMYAPVQLPPTPAAYSAYGSPVSTMSPLALPSFATYQIPQHHYPSPSWNMPAPPSMPAMTQAHASPLNPPVTYAPAPAPSYATEPSHSPASWTGMPSTTYTNSMSAPATPEEPTNLQYTNCAVVKHHSFSYSAPADMKVEDEDEGDILIGLGLYDTPEKRPVSLLGASFVPSGKGLKLEAAWAPAEDEEDDDDEEDDAESEEE